MCTFQKLGKWNDICLPSPFPMQRVHKCTQFHTAIVNIALCDLLFGSSFAAITVFWVHWCRCCCCCCCCCCWKWWVFILPLVFHFSSSSFFPFIQNLSLAQPPIYFFTPSPTHIYSLLSPSPLLPSPPLSSLSSPFPAPLLPLLSFPLRSKKDFDYTKSGTIGLEEFVNMYHMLIYVKSVSEQQTLLHNVRILHVYT